MITALRDPSNDGLIATPGSLTDVMRSATNALHARAERSGVVIDLLRGQASRDGYALLLRNLLPAYQRLESGLEGHRGTPFMQAVVRPELYRVAALKSDLNKLAGREWDRELPLLEAGEHYAQRVAVAAMGDGAGLIGHAYTRYFGDLSGGQVLKRLLGRTLGLRPEELSFFEFPEITDTAVFKKNYRRAIDDCGVLIDDVSTVVSEAVAAFELNIAVFESVQRASAYFCAG
jgi:heme oxygenase (biliverdin-producing, ferredoxin)